MMMSRGHRVAHRGPFVCLVWARDGASRRNIEFRMLNAGEHLLILDVVYNGVSRPHCCTTETVVAAEKQ